MDVLRTPEDRFDNLAGFPFAPRFLDIADTADGRLRMHYVDEGAQAAAPVLLLHGEPTWSYLYRHMIAPLVVAGHRVVAPDLIGFGRSDKPARRADFTYQRHVDWMAALLTSLDLRHVTLFCQDWGGLIGLRLLARFPERFARLVVANTMLPTGDQPLSDAFRSWRAFSQSAETMRVGRIVYGGAHKKIDAATQAAYDAPFPDARYQAGALQFPLLVPDRPDDPASEPNRAAWRVLESLDLPVLTAFGAEDKIMAGQDKIFQTRMKGAEGQPHVLLPGAGHFLQEDVGPDLADLTNAFIARTA